MNNEIHGMLTVVRGYLPLLAGIAVAVANLAITHGALPQEIRRMETIVVMAKRLPQHREVVKMETIVVTAKREQPEVAVAYLVDPLPAALDQ